LLNHILEDEKEMSTDANDHAADKQKSDHVLMTDRLNQWREAKRKVDQKQREAFVEHLHAIEEWLLERLEL
jgi:hypothetical protein